MAFPLVSEGVRSSLFFGVYGKVTDGIYTSLFATRAASNKTNTAEIVRQKTGDKYIIHRPT